MSDNRVSTLKKVGMRKRKSLIFLLVDFWSQTICLTSTRPLSVGRVMFVTHNNSGLRPNMTNLRILHFQARKCPLHVPLPPIPSKPGRHAPMDVVDVVIRHMENLRPSPSKVFLACTPASHTIETRTPRPHGRRRCCHWTHGKIAPFTLKGVPCIYSYLPYHRDPDAVPPWTSSMLSLDTWKNCALHLQRCPLHLPLPPMPSKPGRRAPMDVVDAVIGHMEKLRPSPSKVSPASTPTSHTIKTRTPRPHARRQRRHWTEYGKIVIITLE
ncbi:hypothetical protein C8R44DRAFT_891282 [Mycena epipterygia]|nr:hypothetical protein C8R44DRAFT_891282 [Mycena epipterygia]